MINVMVSFNDEDICGLNDQGSIQGNWAVTFSATSVSFLAKVILWKLNIMIEIMHDIFSKCYRVLSTEGLIKIKRILKKVYDI